MTESSTPTRVIVAITGATGAVFGVRILERLREFDAEVHLIVTAWGARTLEHETPLSVSDVKRLADVVHSPTDQGASVSSGSFRTHGMVIAPCSMKTLAAIANGYGRSLVPRAADVVMKEDGKLVLLVRESPFNALHLENMLRLARLGVRIVPPLPAFYNHPETIDDLVDHIVTRTLDQLSLISDRTPRWEGNVQRWAGPEQGTQGPMDG